MTVRILEGDCRLRLAELEAGSVHTCVTSPPYFGLRDYGHEGQMGLEPTHDEFVAGMVAVFREVRRVLRDDGTLWLNIGDSYRDKQVIGIPWRLAFALQRDGWLLRQDIIWSKPNPVPESAKDRCTKAHEYVFLLAKTKSYYFDSAAISEPSIVFGRQRTSGIHSPKTAKQYGTTGDLGVNYDRERRIKRSVWDIPTHVFRGAHFATFPPDLIEPCILAGSPKGGMVLDPFFGAGTTGLVSDRLGRDCIGVELNPDYAEIARKRLMGDGGMFTEIAA